MDYIKIKPNEYLVRKFKSLEELKQSMASDQYKNEIWKDFPKIEWKIKVYLGELMITAGRRSAIDVMQNKKNYERNKIYNIH